MIDIDLFAGAGGLAIGLKAAGFGPTALYENDPRACSTLRQNVSSERATIDGTINEIDVREVQWGIVAEPVRLLAAGAPCQPFSLGGKHLANHDGRNLFPEVLRAIRALRPKGVLVENVRGLLRESFRPYFEYIIRQLEAPSMGPRRAEVWQEHDRRIRKYQCSPNYEPEYRVSWRLCEAADYGVPQTRQRVFIVATRCDQPVYEFPKPTHSRAALLASQRSGEYWERHDIPRKKGVLGDGGLLVLPLPEDGARLPWLTVRDALADLPRPASSEESAWRNHWLVPGARRYTGHGGSQLDWPSKTIKAGVHGVPGGENTVIDDTGHFRYYTLREIARIQTFPDEHDFLGARLHVTRHIGNAVPCALATAIARPLHQLPYADSSKAVEVWK